MIPLCANHSCSRGRKTLRWRYCSSRLAKRLNTEATHMGARHTPRPRCNAVIQGFPNCLLGLTAREGGLCNLSDLAAKKLDRRPVATQRAACADVCLDRSSNCSGSHANRPNWLPIIPALTDAQMPDPFPALEVLGRSQLAPGKPGCQAFKEEF
jgi:hypothetical protein